MRNLLLLLLMLCSIQLQAQQRRSCSSHDKLQHQLMADPAMNARRAQIEFFTKQIEMQRLASPQRGTPTYTIPVVFHVVYRTAAENISDAQIMSQLAILNEDFQKLNADTNLVPAAFRSVYADCKIQFCLARRDPAGNATTGINRRLTTVTSFADDDRMKSNATGGITTWDASRYMNIWVCNLGASLLGYAQFPGGPAATDGVVLNYTCTGNVGTATAPFHKGRTATHEVGHYLNLYHIWGDDGSACNGSDEVGDTPNQGADNGGCPTFPKISCSNGPNGDMFMNYMDYTDDACMMMFTNGQRTRMYGVLQPGGARASLASSNACSPVAIACTVPTPLAADNITTSAARLRWRRVAGAIGYVVQWKTAAATTYTNRLVVTDTVQNIAALVPGTAYQFVVRTRCTATDSSALSAVQNFTTTAAPIVCNPPIAPTATSTHNSAVLRWRRQTNATGYVLEYKTQSATSFIRITGIADTFFTINGLLPSTIYQYQLRSRCTATDSSSLGSINSFSTTAAPAIVCTAPASSTVSTITTNGARIGWRRSASAASYVLLYKTAAATAFTMVRNITDSTLLLSGLLPATTYQYQLRTRCTNGDSSALTALASFATAAPVLCTAPALVGVDKVMGSSARITWRRSANATRGYALFVKTNAATTFTRRVVTDTSITLTGLVAGTGYQYQLRSLCAVADSSALSALGTFATSTAGCVDLFEPNNTVATSRALTTNVNHTALINASTDQDYYSFTTTTTARNLKITMSGLPADYDLRLLSSTGAQIRISENPDTLSESIVMNNSTGGSYRLHVYGYEGAFHASRCYTLRITASSALQSRTTGTEPVLFTKTKNRAGSSFVLSPQPATQWVRIAAKNGQTGRYNLLISSAAGVQMHRQVVQLEGGNAQIDVSRLPSGLYFVQMTNGEESTTERLLIQR